MAQRKQRWRWLAVSLTQDTRRWVDSLARRTGITPSRVMSLIVTLELDRIQSKARGDDLAHPDMPRPRDIVVGGAFPLLNTFGHRETELAAIFIVRFCQQENRWRSFTQEELDEAYKASEAGKRRATAQFLLYDLQNTLVIRGSDGRYRVTEEFIQRCHRWSERVRRSVEERGPDDLADDFE